MEKTFEGLTIQDSDAMPPGLDPDTAEGRMWLAKRARDVSYRLMQMHSPTASHSGSADAASPTTPPAGGPSRTGSRSPFDGVSPFENPRKPPRTPDELQAQTSDLSSSFYGDLTPTAEEHSALGGQSGRLFEHRGNRQNQGTLIEEDSGEGDPGCDDRQNRYSTQSACTVFENDSEDDEDRADRKHRASAQTVYTYIEEKSDEELDDETADTKRWSSQSAEVPFYLAEQE